MRFNTTVEGARWDEDAQVWKVALADGETLTSRFLITATGFLSQPHTPDIPGITGFKGRIIHTTAWDDGYDFDGHRVAVIGTGATAVQLIPELSKKAADLTVYQRTAIHVVPKFDFPIPPFLRRLFARVPLVQRGFRWVTDNILELMMVSAVLRYHRFHRLNIAAADLAKTHRLLSVRDKELRRPADPGLRLRLQAADVLELLLPRIQQAARPPPDHRHRTDRAGRHRRQRRHQDRHRHPRAGHRLRPVGRQLPRHRDHRPHGPQPRKVVARQQVPGLRGRVDPLLPQLPEPREPIRVQRVVVLQHDGIPDAAHGSAVRRAAPPQGHHVRGDRGRQRRVPGPDDQAAGQLGVLRR